MKKFVTIAVLMMAAMIICSCGGSGGSEGDNAPVKVSLFVDSADSNLAKIASVDPSGATYDYYYAAIPQWTGVDFTSIQGSTGGTDANPTYKKITYTAANTSIGLFAQGTWKFYVQVKLKDSETVLYEGSTGVEYINASHTSVTIDVTRKANAGTATVSVDIEVPIVSAGTVLTAAYDGGSITLDKTTNESASNKPTHGAGWARFKGTSSALQAGSYTFTLTSSDGTNTVGGAVLAFDIIPGEDRSITGTIENGVWQTTLLTINVPTLTVNVTGSATATVGTATTYTCTATSANLAQGDTVTYQWYVGTTTEYPNAQSPIASTGSTYAFNPAAAGYYYITCKASVAGKLIASKTLAVKASN